MKLSRILILVALVAIGLGLVWRLAPGCRQRAADVYRQYGGWTEEARRADPVGFIEHAEAKLADDLDTFSGTRAALADAAVHIQDELKRNSTLLDAAEGLAGRFREAYRSAGADGAWPVQVEGASYGRDDLIEQVRLVLLQRDNYRQTIAQLQSAASAASDKQQQLATQINTTKAALATLPAKKEIARVNQLTAHTEELMKQVNDVLQENADILTESPVRTVEQLTQQQAAGTGQKDMDAEVKTFLEGTE